MSHGCFIIRRATASFSALVTALAKVTLLSCALAQAKVSLKHDSNMFSTLPLALLQSMGSAISSVHLVSLSRSSAQQRMKQGDPRAGAQHGHITIHVPVHDMATSSCTLTSQHAICACVSERCPGICGVMHLCLVRHHCNMRRPCHGHWFAQGR